MKTVKEVSALAGISVRTLHYYDEIGLLRPTAKSEGGYRLYDDKALERLRQILFFREFDIPLKEIKAVLADPGLEKTQILQMQKKMLEAKRDRMDRLIASIDNILKGENKMDFTVFQKSELEAIAQSTQNRMPAFLREAIVQEFGSMDQWRDHFIQRASKKDMQRGYQKLAEWYGDKERALRSMTHPPAPEIVKASEKRIDAVLQKLAAKRELPVGDFAVRETVAEYGFVVKRLYHMKHESGMMLMMAESYRREDLAAETDRRYGAGAAAFFAAAIEAFYGGNKREEQKETRKEARK